MMDDLAAELRLRGLEPRYGALEEELADRLHYAAFPTYKAPRVHTALTADNDFQNHRLPRCRDPDFPLRALNLFPTNDAEQ
jgi:hypothetical protein